MKLRETIKSTLGLANNPTIAPPSPESEKGRRDTNPTCALVKGILPEKEQELIERVSPQNTLLTQQLTAPQRFISTPNLTVFFIPFNPPPYHFVTTLKGFIFLDESDRETEELVENIVGETLFPNDNKLETGSTIRRFIAKNKDNIPALIQDIETTLRYLRSSIEVKCLNLVKKEDIGMGEGQSHPAWNVYIYPPSKNNAALREWRTTIQNTTFATDSNKAGKTFKLFRCAICRSIDHPGGMCPYPSQQGWIPPTPTVIDEILNANNPPRVNREARPNTRGRSAGPNGRGRNATGNRNASRT